MTTIGGSFQVTGEVRVTSDVTLGCRIDGMVLAEGCAVTLTAAAVVTGDVLAREITLAGRVSGRLVATERVHIQPGAVVAAQVVAPHLTLDEGAKFNGRVEPQHLEAALRVAKFQQQRRDL